MQNQSIVLLGGSNSVRQNGLQLGLKEAVESHNKQCKQNINQDATICGGDFRVS